MHDGFEIRTFHDLNESALKTIEDLEKLIFDQPMTAHEIMEEAKNKTDLITLVSFVNDKPCGYKVGFQHSSQRFYSWIGGVHPEFRNLGVAKELMREQHKIAKKLGYKYVFTHTKNKFRAMLVLNIKSGFDVIGFRHNLGSASPSIILEKAL